MQLVVDVAWRNEDDAVDWTWEERDHLFVEAVYVIEAQLWRHPNRIDQGREDIRVVFERDDHLRAVGFEGDTWSVG